MSEWFDELDDQSLQIIGAFHGEPVLIVPRTIGEFSGFRHDTTRDELELTAVFSDHNAFSTTMAGRNITNADAPLDVGRVRFTLRQRDFANTDAWPRQDDLVVRPGDGGQYCITNVLDDNAAGIDVWCVREA